MKISNSFKFEKIEPLFLKEDFNNDKVVKAYTKFIYDIAYMLNPNITDLNRLNNEIEKMVRLERLMRLNVRIDLKIDFLLKNQLKLTRSIYEKGISWRYRDDL